MKVNSMFGIIITALIFSFSAGNPIPEKLEILADNDSIFPQGFIVGGQQTLIEQHPWQVSLQAYGFHFCGGSIISETVILTAGHCTSYSPDLIKIRVGTGIAESGGVVHDVEEVVRHEGFKKRKNSIPENDISVVKLKTPIKFGKTTHPVRLFDQGEVAQEGALAKITGWGALEENGSVPLSLMVVQIPIVNKVDCNKAYEDWDGIPDGQICAAYPDGGKDTCQGDSGGPLVIANRQAGIVSWGNGCARKGYPGVYTEIASYRDWIKKNSGV